MKGIFCHQYNCLVNKHYRFLRSIQNKLCQCPEKSPKNIQFKVYQKDTEKDHVSKLEHENRIPNPLFVTELIHSLSPNDNGRYVGFAYFNGKTIYHLNKCQLAEDKVFHIHVIIRQENIDGFVHYSSNPYAWEFSNSEKLKSMSCHDICFEE